MNERDELPNWVGEPERGTAPGYSEPPRRGRTALAVLAGLAVLLGMGAVGYFIAQSRAEGDTTSAEDVAGPSVDSDSADDIDADDSENESDGDTQSADDESADDESLTVAVEDDDEDMADDDAAESDEDSSDDADATTGDPNDSTRTAVFRGGKLYLGGKVPSQEVADLIAGKAFAVVGPDNVVVEYEIDPNVVIDPGESTPLYVEDVVLFQFNSVEIDAPFIPLLDLGTLLLSQNPQATLTVVTRTDAVGSEAVNLEVAGKRADAVINYWLKKGVSRDQLIADPRGEEGASDSDDEQTAALQRRAEFIITGLLDS